MGFSDYREERIAEHDVPSHAEVLAAMDCLMHHMNDEDELSCWLQDGVPDSGFWGLLDEKADRGTFYTDPAEGVTCKADRKTFYTDLAKGMTYGDYEACVKIFACTVKEQCFKTKYQPRSFT